MAVTGLALGGCFDPTYKAGIACDEGACPPGYECRANVCVETGSGGDDSGDGGDGDGDGSGNRDGGLPPLADAGPDAAPVGCTSDDDCANPDDPCALPGTCEDSVCQFGAMDCSELDNECAAGVCEAGACVARAVHEREACGAGLMACGAFGSCLYEGDATCDMSGEKTRSCTDSSCQAGQCVTGMAYENAATCGRDTEDTPCGSTVDECADSNCDYDTVCSPDAPDLSGNRTTKACENSTCATASTPCTNDCERGWQETTRCTFNPGPGQGWCAPGGGCVDNPI